MLDACLQPASWPIYQAGNLLFLIFIHVIQQNEFVSHRSLCPGSGLPRHIDRETEYATQPRNIPGQFTNYFLGSGHATCLRFNRKGDYLASGRVRSLSRPYHRNERDIDPSY